MREEYAHLMADLEAEYVASGAEGQLSSNAVVKVTGRPPKGFVEFALKNRQVWV